MSITGKVFTRFRPQLYFSLIARSTRPCAVFSPKLAFNYHTTWNNSLKVELHRNPLFKKNSQVRTMSALSPLDPSSFSRPEIALVKHISLSFDVDFEKKVLSGSAVLTVEAVTETNEVILDASNLTIQSIESEDGSSLQYNLAEAIPNYGSKLTITLPKTLSSEENITGTVQLEFTGVLYRPVSDPGISREANGYSCDACANCGRPVKKGSTKNICGQQKCVKITIKYATAPSASALQWLEPSQTSGKQHPYLFSQCQPIHARSIVPCQDTPAVKFTYDAQVTAPSPFTVLMSALRGECNGSATSFRQPVPVPSYLLAIAVGVLESRRLGPRSLVWSEKEEIERSAWEFADTEKYLQAAERLCGEYVWGQYDLLVLPPSFPYGGMENPCLTFVTPTLLAGDRSQADVIVHEIMHSWTGNLVTNRNFEHFWLNEGFTVFLERKVGASLIADADEAKRSRDFHSLLGLQELSETVHDHFGPSSPLTKLVVDLKGVHPDDAFSRVPYEKGSLFLRYLEDLSGGPGVFDDFLRAYLNQYKRKSLDTDQFKAFLLNYFKDNASLKTVDWNAWLYTSGMPPVIPNYDTSMTKAVTTLLGKIEQPNATLSYDDIKAFTPHQIINLLQELIDRPALSIDKLRTLGETYKVNSATNSEILYRWLRLCVRSKDLEKLPEVFNFVNHQGRMKYVRPIYRDLYAWQDVRQRAIDNFLANEKYMMHVSAYTLRKDLHLDS